MLKISYLSIFFLTIFINESFSTLRINEVIASNTSIIADEDGDFEDWIEIINIGSTPVDLTGYGLSDSNKKPFKWKFPQLTLIPSEIIIVWASGKDRTNPGLQLHTNFSIAKDGEEILITDPNHIQVDKLPPTELLADHSIGRKPDGTGEWYFFQDPTPGQPNISDGFQGILPPPRLSHIPGFYSDSFYLQIEHSDSTASIFYTLDGSTPNESTCQYTGPILIYDRSQEDNELSQIPTNNIKSGRAWNAPTKKIAKATVIRVSAYKTGYVQSEPLSATFFVFPEGANRYSLPVFSVITEKNNFFSDSIGIYVPGVHHIEGNDGTGNYYMRGEKWERPGHLEFFELDGSLQLAQNAGFRIHGGFPRRFHSKSLRVYARNSYGENYLNCRFFPELSYNNYKRIILRPSGNDIANTMLSDGISQTIVRHLNFDTQSFRPAIIFINGEYWGIKKIREIYDKHYLRRVYGVDPDNIDLLTRRYTVNEGDNVHYKKVLKFVTTNDLADSATYSTLLTYIDMENFLDYYSAQIFFANNDWPQNNHDFWRVRKKYDPQSPPGHDGRYRWMMWTDHLGIKQITKPTCTPIFLIDPIGAVS